MGNNLTGTVIMRFWFVLLLGALLSGRCISTNDPSKELEGCGVSLFSFIMTRLNQQVEEYTACQQLNAGNSNYDCSENSRTELIACGSTLFQLAAIRISHQFAEFEECKRSDADASNAKDCSESIKRATADLQQGLHDYNHCTKDIR
uniref:Protein TsetseEP domain-containing protein n=1 Tax=Anopheles culicifacies TaxID=139723 RepID=A0A182LYQ7_9DIPT